MKLQEGIIDTAQEIFSTMLMVEVTPTENQVDNSIKFEDNISGVIGLSGNKKSFLAVHFPSSVAIKMTASFLGMEEDEVAEDVDDAVGEIANMMGGNIKALLSDRGRDIELSLPTIVRGNYTLTAKGTVKKYVIPFTSDVGKFIVEFQIES